MSWVSLELLDDDSQPTDNTASRVGPKNTKQRAPSRAASVEKLDDYEGFPEDAIIRKGRSSQQNDIISRSKRKADDESNGKGRLKNVSQLKGVKIEADSLLSDLNDVEDIDSEPEPAPKRHKPTPDAEASQPLVTFNEEQEYEKDVFDNDRTQVESVVAQSKKEEDQKNQIGADDPIGDTQPLSGTSNPPSGPKEHGKRLSLVLHYDTDDDDQEDLKNS